MKYQVVLGRGSIRHLRRPHLGPSCAHARFGEIIGCGRDRGHRRGDWRLATVACRLINSGMNGSMSITLMRSEGLIHDSVRAAEDGQDGAVARDTGQRARWRTGRPCCSRCNKAVLLKVDERWVSRGAELGVRESAGCRWAAVAVTRPSSRSVRRADWRRQ